MLWHVAIVSHQWPTVDELRAAWRQRRYPQSRTRPFPQTHAGRSERVLFGDATPQPGCRRSRLISKRRRLRRQRRILFPCEPLGPRSIDQGTGRHSRASICRSSRCRIPCCRTACAHPARANMMAAVTCVCRVPRAACRVPCAVCCVPCPCAKCVCAVRRVSHRGGLAHYA